MKVITAIHASLTYIFYVCAAPLMLLFAACNGDQNSAPALQTNDSISLQQTADSIITSDNNDNFTITIDSIALRHKMDTLIYDTTFYAGQGGAHDTTSPYFYRYYLRCIQPTPNAQCDLVCDTIRRAMTLFLTGYDQSDMIRCAAGCFGRKVLQYKDGFRKATNLQRKENFAILEQRKARIIREDEDMMCVAFLSTTHNMAVRRIPKVQQNFVVFDKHTAKRMTLADWLPSHKQEQVRTLIISRILQYNKLKKAEALTSKGYIEPDAIIVSPSFIPTRDSVLFAYEPNQLCPRRKFIALSYEELLPFGSPKSLMTRYVRERCREKALQRRNFKEFIDTTVVEEDEIP